MCYWLSVSRPDDPEVSFLCPQSVSVNMLPRLPRARGTMNPLCLLIHLGHTHSTCGLSWNKKGDSFLHSSIWPMGVLGPTVKQGARQGTHCSHESSQMGKTDFSQSHKCVIRAVQEKERLLWKNIAEGHRNFPMKMVFESELKGLPELTMWERGGRQSLQHKGKSLCLPFIQQSVLSTYSVPGTLLGTSM